MIDIPGIIINWIIARHYYRKSSKNGAEMEARLKECINNTLKNFFKDATPEQKEKLYSTTNNYAKTIAEILHDTVIITDKLTATLNPDNSIPGPGSEKSV